MSYIGRLTLLLAAVWALAGCNGPALTKCKSPLMPARMSSDSIVLEMFFVRFPFDDPTVNGELWEKIDEQQFAPELRGRLARNGFRAGLVDGQMPDELSKLLDPGVQPPADGIETKPENGEGEKKGETKGEMNKVEDFTEQPRVVHRRLQTRPGQRSEIIASGVYDQLPVLLWDSGRISGRTYSQAQGMFEVKTYSQPDGRVRLELVPELHHDQMRQRWVGGQGVIRLDASRPKTVYDEMAVSVDLVPGAMLILSSLSNRPGSLGHHFFTEKDGRLEQKLLVIRLAQTQHDGLFNPPEPLELDR